MSYDMSNNTDAPIISTEKGFSLNNIEKEILFTQMIIKKVFEKRIRTIKRIIDYQTRLTGHYMQCCVLKKRMGLVCDNNVVLNNTLGNQPYQSYSTIVLLESGFYGSSRVILRQFFEALIIAKYSEFDNGKIIEKWTNKMENNRNFDIQLTRDVLNNLKNIDEVKNYWRQLCDASHPTKYSQQPIRVPILKNTKKSKHDIKKWIEGTNLLPNVAQTLDTFFMILCMNYHLLNSRMGKKAYRWYLGYVEDPLNYYKRERKIKSQIKRDLKLYFRIADIPKPVEKSIKASIFQYKRKWK